MSSKDWSRKRHHALYLTRLITLLLITTGVSIGGLASAPLAPSSRDVSQQRMRFQEMEDRSVVPEPVVAADDVGGRPDVPSSVVVSDDSFGRSAAVAGVSKPRTTASPASSLVAPVAPDGRFEPGHIVAPELHVPPEVALPEKIDMPPPSHITIPAVGVDADVVEVEPYLGRVDQQLVQMWHVADWAAGHHVTTATPGEGGNIVIAGHDDVRGEVFRGLHDIDIGDEVHVASPAGTFTYIVEEVHLRRELGVPLAERLAVAQFMAPMPEERLTLITCWPYGIDDHRLIVVAKPHVDSP